MYLEFLNDAETTSKMDLQFGYNTVTLFCCLSFLWILLNIWKKAKQLNSNQKLPPGPSKLPVIGSIHHLIKSGLPPHHVLRNLAQKHGPLMHLQLGEISAIVVSSPRIAEAVMKTHDLSFASRPKLLTAELILYNYRDVAFCPYNEYWRQMRKICVLELLSAKNVRSFGPIRQDEVSHMIESIRSSVGKSVDLREKITTYTSSMVCRAAFGNLCSLDQRKLFVQVLWELTTTASGFDLADLFPSFKVLHYLTGMKPKVLRYHRQMDRILEDILNAHIETSGERNGAFGEEDLIDTLLRIKESGELQFPISKNDIKAVIYDMFAAGTETSSTALEWTLSEIMRNPRVMSKAQSEIREAFKGKNMIEENDLMGLKYMKLVIKESLRLHPVPLLVPRECREDCEIDGYKIATKTKVIINAWTIGRDPEYWDDPETFKPERFDGNPVDFTGNHFQFIPFGAGRRMCAGMSFGLANIELPLALLLYHFDWKLSPGVEELDMTETIGATAPMKHNLHLVPTLHHPAP